MVGFNSWNTFVYVLCWLSCVLSHSVVSSSLVPNGLQPARFLCPWNLPGKNTEMSCHLLLQGIFLTEGSNPRLLHLLPWQRDSLPMHHLERPSTSSTNSKNSHTYAHHITKKKHGSLVLPIDAGNFTLYSQRGRIPSTKGPSSPSTMDGTVASLPSWFRPQGPHDGLSESYTAHGWPSIHDSAYHKAIILKWSSFGDNNEIRKT